MDKALISLKRQLALQFYIGAPQVTEPITLSKATIRAAWLLRHLSVSLMLPNLLERSNLTFRF